METIFIILVKITYSDSCTYLHDGYDIQLFSY